MGFRYGLGWRKDRLDWRDGLYRYQMAGKPPIDEKADIDLTTLPAMQFPIYEQLQTNACVGTSVGRNVQYLMRAQGVMDFRPSVNFIYWAGRRVIGEVTKDDGCQIRDAFNQLAKIGVPKEEDWPFRMDLLKRNPPPQVIKKAAQHIALTYQSVPQKLDHILSCLTHRLPVVAGMTVFEFWQNEHVTETGDIPMPIQSMRPTGGHAIILVGWRAEDKRFIFANSWGRDWGFEGYGTLPADYVLNPDLAADLWSAFLMSKTDEEKARK